MVVVVLGINSFYIAFASGNVAVCIIDNESGQMWGKMWGSDKIAGRNFYKNAWIKASQARRQLVAYFLTFSLVGLDHRHEVD